MLGFNLNQHFSIYLVLRYENTFFLSAFHAFYCILFPALYSIFYSRIPIMNLHSILISALHFHLSIPILNLHSIPELAFHSLTCIPFLKFYSWTSIPFLNLHSIPELAFYSHFCINNKFHFIHVKIFLPKISFIKNISLILQIP